jgi:hypothetical protein
MLTQLARVSEARHIALDQVVMTVSPRFSQEGSILADTIQSRLLDIETSLEITTSAPREAVAQLIATAERMCFMMDAIRQPHEVRTRVTVNGTAMT